MLAPATGNTLSPTVTSGDGRTMRPMDEGEQDINETVTVSYKSIERNLNRRQISKAWKRAEYQIHQFEVDALGNTRPMKIDQHRLPNTAAQISR